MKVRDLLQHVLVINLDQDTNRLDNALRQLKEVGVKPVRIQAIYGRTLPHINEMTNNMSGLTNKTSAVGCGLSHRKAWTEIIANDWDYALILEDDFHINSSFRGALDIELPDDWDIVYLGHGRNKWPRNVCSRIPQPNYDTPVNEHWYHFTNTGDAPMGCWAYVIKKKVAHYLIRHYQLKQPVDGLMSLQQTLDELQVYGLFPSIFIHCYSDGSRTRYGDSKKGISPGLLWVLFIPVLLAILLLISFLLVKNRIIRIGIILGIIICIIIIVIRIKKVRNESNFIFNHSHIYTNLPGSFGVHPYDPFGNVWTDETKKLLINLLERITSICDHNDIPIVPAYGSMLGWARHKGKIIPWDDDFDVFINETDEEKLVNLLRKQQDILLTKGRHAYNYKISVVKGIEIPEYSYTYPFIDIFLYRVKTNHILIPCLGRKIPSTNINTFRTAIEGVSIDMFYDYPKWLEHIYGKDWDTMCVSSSWNHRMEKSIDSEYRAKVKCDLLGLD